MIPSGNHTWQLKIHHLVRWFLFIRGIPIAMFDDRRYHCIWSRNISRKKTTLRGVAGTQTIPRAALDWHLVWLDFDLLSYRREPHRTAVVMGLLGVPILPLVASRLAVTVGEYCCLPMLIRCKIYYDILDTDTSIYLSVCLSNLI